MKCPKTVPAMMKNGEVKRPERPCTDEMQKLEENLYTCPMHGLVEVVTEHSPPATPAQPQPPPAHPPQPGVPTMDLSESANGKPKRWFRRG